MLARTKRLAAATALSGTLLIGLAPAVGAQPVFQRGLVNVNVGDVTIAEDVNVAVAAQVAAAACDLVDVGAVNLAVLGQALSVVRTGDQQTICTTDQGPVTISQE
jgi:hypothetical protein